MGYSCGLYIFYSPSPVMIKLGVIFSGALWFGVFSSSLSWSYREISQLLLSTGGLRKLDLISLRFLDSLSSSESSLDSVGNLTLARNLSLARLDRSLFGIS